MKNNVLSLRQFGSAAVLTALMVLSIGCSNIVLKQPALRMQYYSIDYPATRAAQPANIPATIRFQRFRVAPDYNSRQIIYSEDIHTKNAYVYHQWRSHPGDLVPYLLSRDLDRSGHFQVVYPPGSKTRSSFQIEGSLESFYERDTDESYDAVLAMAITVIANDPSIRVPTSVMHRHFQTIEPMNGRGAEYFAEAMSRAMAQVSRDLREVLIQVLADHPSLPSKGNRSQ